MNSGRATRVYGSEASDRIVAVSESGHMAVFGIDGRQLSSRFSEQILSGYDIAVGRNIVVVSVYKHGMAIAFDHDGQKLWEVFGLERAGQVEISKDNVCIVVIGPEFSAVRLSAVDGSRLSIDEGARCVWADPFESWVMVLMRLASKRWCLKSHRDGANANIFEVSLPPSQACFIDELVVIGENDQGHIACLESSGRLRWQIGPLGGLMQSLTCQGKSESVEHCVALLPIRSTRQVLCVTVSKVYSAGARVQVIDINNGEIISDRTIARMNIATEPSCGEEYLVSRRGVLNRKSLEFESRDWIIK